MILGLEHVKRNSTRGCQGNHPTVVTMNNAHSTLHLNIALPVGWVPRHPRVSHFNSPTQRAVATATTLLS